MRHMRTGDHMKALKQTFLSVMKYSNDNTIAQRIAYLNFKCYIN